ncbi:hypothetical protein DM02DRAFT_528246 [Periconia macrospinosa]|uniref:Uncharacterized protein n=1 Tax=Periconia macrospinosa TaxID=97972 RepID=A0A2V1DR54_9PLEO|nr:hypothetical protein DM02DRAFT_528246 [Periconia macrospinosa]
MAAAAQEATTVGYISGDNQRDTISLLVSCFATLGLCVYSAVHLNVPAKREPYYEALFRQLKWCLIGLFAPELVLYTAWRQYASARQLCDEVEQARSKLRDRSKSATQSPRYTWTLAHGFYGTMGGIAVEIESNRDTSPYAYIFGDAKRLTLTAKGVALLAHCGLLPDISLDEIKDKNKADGLAKFLVCVQAGWMMIQVISRAAVGLPTTLLEVNTVAHVVCALLMYVVWWHKPRQVTAPTLLPADGLWPLVAYMYSASRLSGQRPDGIRGMIMHAKPELKKLAYIEGSDSNGANNNGRFVPLPQKDAIQQEEAEIFTSEDEEFQTRRQLANEAVMQYPAIRERFKEPKNRQKDTGKAQYLLPYSTELVQPYSLNWPNAGLLRRTQSLVMGMTLWGASMVYGAIHVSAWKYFFPTYAEKLLWHLSSVWVTFCAGFWLSIHLLAYFFPVIDRIWNGFNQRRLGWFATSVIFLLCTICGVSFVGSRAYLVIEAFVSIREVPTEVYDTPNWSQVFPHL